MKKAIFLSNNKGSIASVYAPDVIERLRETAELCDTVYSRADVLAKPSGFADVEIIFSTWGMPTFSEAEIKAIFPRLKCVFYAAGSVQGFARPFLACGVRVFSAWAANGIPVAEYTVAQIILANKGFFTHTSLMRAQKVSEAHAIKGQYRGNFGQRVGLIGCGMIGSMVAERLKEYRLEVLVFDPFLSTERASALGVESVSLPALFASCSVVSNHLANNAQTRGMLTYELFASMPPRATFLNTGRGAQVAEDDLVRALREREDLTAVLDVTDPEPPAPCHPFYSLPNCHLTPHIAGSLGNEVVRMAEFIVEEWERYRSGEDCLWEVSEAMLETMA